MLCRQSGKSCHHMPLKAHFLGRKPEGLGTGLRYECTIYIVSPLRSLLPAAICRSSSSPCLCVVVLSPLRLCTAFVTPAGQICVVAVHFEPNIQSLSRQRPAALLLSTLKSTAELISKQVCTIWHPRYNERGLRCERSTVWMRS